ncbi:MBB1 [Auxenochlorella protothecoides x Auxenochlorella symbiontica]
MWVLCLLLMKREWWDPPVSSIVQRCLCASETLGNPTRACQSCTGPFPPSSTQAQGKSSQALWHTWAALESRRQPVDANRVRALYRRGLQAAPGSRYLLLSWAMWEKAAGDVEAARKLLEQGTQACPRDAALWSAWAKLEEQQGEVGVARELYKQGSVADPSHLYVWQGWGCLEFRQGNNDSARALFQRGISMCPPRAKSAAHLFQPWAVLESRNGNTRLARELFKCAVKADPESSPSWNAWADMEANLGALERANELRNFSMQERREVVKPFNFTTLPKAGTFSSMVAKLLGREDLNDVIPSEKNPDMLFP